MYRILKHLLIFLVFLFEITHFNSVFSAPVETFVMPDLSTEEKRLDWLLDARNNLPGLFVDAAKYDIDLMLLLEDQNRLQELLLKHPGYLKEMQERHPGWLTVTIAPKSEQVVKTIQINPKAVEDWKKAFLTTLHSLPQKQSIHESLVKEIAEQSAWINGRSSQGLETGLVMSLSPEDRKLVFAAKPEEKLSLLSSKLPEKIGESFQASVYGLQSGPSKTEVLDLLKKLKGSEERLRELTELHIVLQNTDGKIVDNTAAAHLNSLSVNDLDFFTEANSLSSKLKKLEEEVPRQNISKLMSPVILKRTKSFTSQVEVIEVKIEKGIKLVEVPPGLGIFRGCAGGDCSTQYSFPFPNAPNEKVFYIYGDDGHVKGYVTGSIVEVNKKPTFQVITIAGPRMSFADAALTLEGLNRIKKELKVEQLVLPIKENVEKLMNYTPIVALYNTEVEGKPLVDIKYTDAAYRSEIEKFESEYNHTSAGYDKMETNNKGVLYVGHADESLAVEVTTRAEGVVHISPENKKRYVFELVMDLLGANRDKQVPRVLAAAHISEAESIELFTNPKGLSIPAYQEEIKKVMGYSDTELFSRMPSFAKGYLNAPDIRSVQDEPRFIAAVVNEFDKDPVGISKKLTSPKVLKNMIHVSEEYTLRQLAQLVFSKPLPGEFNEAIKALVEKGSPRVLSMVEEHIMGKENIGKKLSVLDYQNRLKQFFGYTDEQLAEHVSSYSPLYFKATDFHIMENDPQFLEHAFLEFSNNPKEVSKKPLTLKMIKFFIDKNHQQTYDRLAEFVFSKPYSKEMEVLLLEMIEKSEGPALDKIVNFVFSEPHVVNNEKILNILVEKVDSHTLRKFFPAIFYFPESVRLEYVLRRIVERADEVTLMELSRHVLSRPHAIYFKDIIKNTIDKGSMAVLEVLAESTFSKPHTKDMEDLIRLLIKKGDSKVLEKLAAFTFNQPHTAHMKEALRELIEKADSKVLLNLERYVFTQPHFKGEEFNQLKELAKARGVAISVKSCQPLYNNL